MDGVDDAAGVGIEAELGARVADVADRVADDLVHVDVRLGANLARDHDEARGNDGLACDARVLRVGGNAIRGDVALRGKLGFLLEDCIENRI